MLEESDSGLSTDHSSSPSSKPDSAQLRITMFHKPRGSKGKFFEVEKGTKVRVSKSAGKKLRLMCFTEFDYDKNTTHLSLMEPAEGSEDTYVPSHHKMEVEVKKKLFLHNPLFLKMD